MNKIFIKKILSPLCKIKYRVKVQGGGWTYIGKNTKIVNPKNLILHQGVQIAPYCLICPHGKGAIILEESVSIGMFSRIACINRIVIEKNVLTGPNVFISDYNHAYQDVNRPISRQGNSPATAEVVIGADSWIGTNVVICGNVHIGRHVVIGAGSFVNRDVPDFCVAVGNPARIVKRYNDQTSRWEKV